MFSPDSRLVVALGSGPTELFALPPFKSVGRLEAPELRGATDVSFSKDGVVEVKPPIAKIQTPWGEHWLKISQVYPEGSCPRSCGN